MIVREVLSCPNCGKWDPWKVYRTVHFDQSTSGEIRRRYVRCKFCGAKEVISERVKV